MPSSNNIKQVLLRLALARGNCQAPESEPSRATDMEQYLAVALAAAVPCVCLAAYHFGARIWAMVLVAALSGAAVEAAFGAVRKKPIGGGALVFAVLLVLFLPPDIPLWMVAVGSAFGCLFGKEAFGGTGSHIFSPVLVAKSFLVFSYPRIVKGSYFGSMLEFDRHYAWLPCCIFIILAGAAMVVHRPGNLRTLGGILLATVCLGVGLQALGHLPFDSVGELGLSDGYLYAACFLACDPACSPRRKSGKLLYGALIGICAVLMRTFSTYHEAMLSAILIGNLFAPTIDALSEIQLGRRAEQ